MRTWLVMAVLCTTVGCASDYGPRNYVEGRVTEVLYEPPSHEIEESSGALFGNESVKLGHSPLLIAVETNDGSMPRVLRVEIHGDDGPQTPLNLRFAIKVGTSVIRFPTLYYRGGKNAARIAPDIKFCSGSGLCRIPANLVEVK